MMRSVAPCPYGEPNRWWNEEYFGVTWHVYTLGFTLVQRPQLPLNFRCASELKTNLRRVRAAARNFALDWLVDCYALLAQMMRQQC